MSTIWSPERTRRGRAMIAGAAGLVLALSLAACTTPPGTASSTGASGGGSCGTLPGNPPKDPDNAVSKLPQAAQAGFADFPYTVQASAWATTPAKTGPFTIGYTSLPLINAWGSDAYKYLDGRVKELAAKGTVTSPLQTGIMADPATMTPAEQIALYQQLVDQGVNGIIMIPLSGEAMADAVTAAGKKGVVTVVANGNVPSPYAINVQMNPYLQGLQPAAEALKHFNGKAKVLYVGGIPGETTEQVTNDGFKAMIANCPDVEVVGEVFGQYSSAGAKSAVLQFLASYPGDIDMVVGPGTMGPGIISGFQDAGRTVPMVTATGAQEGEVAFWAQQLASDPGYVNFGTGGTSPEVTEAALQVLLMTLEGQGPITNTISAAPAYITSQNVKDYVKPGADLTSPDQISATKGYLSTDFLQQFFSKPAPIK